jgi:hypothetical protein
MGTVANPLFSSFVPGMNPTGNQISLHNPYTNTKGANPLLPQANLSPNVAGSGNPYDVVPSTGAFPANAGPYATTGAGSVTGPGTASGNPNIGGFAQLDPAKANQLYQDLSKTYGAGTAQAIWQFLQSGAGYNQNAINNLLASLQPGIQRGEEDLMSQFSALGNRFGSGAQIGLGDYLSQVNLNEGQLISQMYEQALTNYIDVLMGAASANAQTKANSPSLLDKILSPLSAITGTDILGNLFGKKNQSSASSGSVPGGTIADVPGFAGLGGASAPADLSVPILSDAAAAAVFA